VEDAELDGCGELDSRSLTGSRRLIDDFLPFKQADGTWQTHKLSQRWNPIEVAGNERGNNDYPTIAFIIPVFSDRAVQALHDFLAPNGELLPLRAPCGSYFVYNVTTLIANALDQKRTRRRGANIIEYHFHAEAVAGVDVFRIWGLRPDLFVSQAFVDRAVERKLRGFDFQQVWSSPDGSARGFD